MLDLEPAHLLTSVTRVSKTFQAFIATTPSLQRKLFFTSDQTNTCPHPVWNSLLLDRYSLYLPGPAYIRLDVPYNIDNAEPNHTALSIELWFEAVSFEQAFRTDASWRSMLVAQATQRFSLYLTIAFGDGWCVFNREVELEPDTTLGSLLDGKMAGVEEWMKCWRQRGSPSLLQGIDNNVSDENTNGVV